MNSARLPRILGAIIYDLFIVCAIIFVAAQWFPLVPENLNDLLAVKLFKQIYILGISFLYFAWSWRRGGQTIGMKAWRIKIVNPDQEMLAVSWRQSMLRYLGAMVSWLFLGLGFLWTVLDREHRSWHDLASGTRLQRLPKSVD